MTGTSHEDRYTFSITSRSVLLIMKHITDKSFRETQNTYFMFSCFFFEKRAVCEIMWENGVLRGRPHMMHAHCMLDN
jgi:hypothetical protein